MRWKSLRIATVPFRLHVVGSLLILAFVSVVIQAQIMNRSRFAAGELYDDVMDRWGAPIVQPAPSVRFVESGAVFSRLEAMPLASQEVVVAASMSYRKRGLVYFSGFDFQFDGRYVVTNDQGFPIDVVFVFPIQVSRNKVLLSDLRFAVGGELAAADLAGEGERLVWTGRLGVDESLPIEIAFRGRGLDSFVYHLDPDLPARAVRVEVAVSGGEGYDYPRGVVPATAVTSADDEVGLSWSFDSLQSGVPVGVILPQELGFDRVIGTMVRRSLPTGLLFFVGVALLGLHSGRPLTRTRSYLVAATYAFFYVLLPYLAAFVHFYLAYGLAIFVVTGLIAGYVERAMGPGTGRLAVGLSVSMLLVPTLAVVLQGYTGLVYTLEILVGLAVLLWASTRSAYDELGRAVLARPAVEAGGHHVA